METTGTGSPFDHMLQDFQMGIVTELDPRLVPFVATEPFPRIVHPLMCVPFYAPVQNKMLNEVFEHKLETYTTLLGEKAWNALLYLVERPFRIQQFAALEMLMSHTDYWTALSFVYTDSEGIDQHSALVKTLLQSPRPHRHYLMDKGEQDAFAELPEVLTLYKGFSDDYDWHEDFSFTTELRVAKWFARRFGCTTPKLLTGTVPKEKALGFLTRRNEQEILVDPQFVTVKSIKGIAAHQQLNNIGGAIFKAINRV